MNSSGPKIKNVSYQRSYQAARTTAICLVGNSRWIQDLELLMEDDWKNLSMAPSLKELSEQISQKAPALFIVERSAYGSSEQHLVESVLPKGSKKLVVSHDRTDILSWTRIKKYCVSQNISTIELPEVAADAARELSEILESWSSTESLDTSADLQLIRDAHLGFLVGARESADSSMVTIFNSLAARFTFEERDLQVCSALVETHKLWKGVHQANDLHLAYLRLSQSVAEKPIYKVLLLSEHLHEHADTKNDLTEEDWKVILSQCDLSLLVRRNLQRNFHSIREMMKTVGVVKRHAKLKLA